MLKWTILIVSDGFMKSSKIPRMVIQFEYFFLIEKQNGESNVTNFRRFLFGVSPEVPAFKAGVFPSDFNF